MTIVRASPSLVTALGRALLDTGVGLSLRAGPLRNALDDFFSSHPEYGPTSSPVPDILERQIQVAITQAVRIDVFVRALELADMAGYASPGTLLGSAVASDVLVLQHHELELFLGDPDTDLFDGVLGKLRTEIEHLEVNPPRPGRMHRSVQRRHAARLAELRGLVSQYEVLASPVHLGWGGVTVPQWRTLDEFDAAVAAATAEARTHAPEPSDAAHARTRMTEDRAARATFRDEHPFLAAAIDSDVLITPQRLDTLLELDSFATMPIDRFLAERLVAQELHPTFDWTADGCSGPIPDRAAHTCFRHDFMYRNGRMIRDQWGTSPAFAEQIKARADDRFGAELFDEYEWYAISGVEALWLWGAEGVVSAFGSVDAAWEPPDPDDFYGGTPPG